MLPERGKTARDEFSLHRTSANCVVDFYHRMTRHRTSNMFYIDDFSCRSVYSRFNFQSIECTFFKSYEEARRKDGCLLPVTLLPHQTPLRCVQTIRTGTYARASACASPLMWTFSRVRARAQGPRFVAVLSSSGSAQRWCF